MTIRGQQIIDRLTVLIQAAEAGNPEAILDNQALYDVYEPWRVDALAGRVSMDEIRPISELTTRFETAMNKLLSKIGEELVFPTSRVGGGPDNISG